MEASVTCPNGHANAPDTEFCSECGQPLTWGQTSVWVVSERSKEFDEGSEPPSEPPQDTEDEAS